MQKCRIQTKDHRTKNKQQTQAKGNDPQIIFLPFFNESTCKTQNALFLNSTIIPASFFNNDANFIVIKDIESRPTTLHLIQKTNDAKEIFY